MDLTQPGTRSPHKHARYRRTPRGIVVPLNAAVRGVTTWQVLDERGVPEVPRTPSGVAVGPAEGITHTNLITNLGMDTIATRNVLSDATNANGYRRFLAVGTGSTAPDFTDTALDNEVQRASSNGGFGNGSQTWEALSADDVLRATILVNRVVTMTADRNLTEYGLGYETTANIMIRDLLRDGGGTPITVSLLNEKTLYLQHSLIIDLPWLTSGISDTMDLEEYDAGNNLVGTITFDTTYGMRLGLNAPTGVERAFNVWRPDITDSTVGIRRLNTDIAWNRGVDSLTDGDISHLGNAQLYPYVRAAYTTGTYERAKVTTITPAQLNGDWYGYFYGRVNTPTARSSWVTGLWVKWEDNTPYVKQDTDELIISMLSTWARA